MPDRSLLARGAAALVLGAMLPALVACSDPPKSGYVVKKAYDDPDDWSYWQPDYITICSGNPIRCYQQLAGGHTVYGHDGPHWEFRVRDDADPKGKRHGWVEVGQATYDSYDVGMHWPDAR